MGKKSYRNLCLSIIDDTVSAQNQVIARLSRQEAILNRARRPSSQAQKHAIEFLDFHKDALNTLIKIQDEIEGIVSAQETAPIQRYLFKGIITDHLLISHPNTEYKNILRTLHARLMTSFEMGSKR